MSWNGVATGAAPFQQPTYASGYPTNPQAPQPGQPPGYNQYQAGLPHSQSSAASQPPKSFPPKKKGNPIITRYPPPPGYRGPAQAQGPFGKVQYPTQRQGYQPGPPAAVPYSTLPHQGPSPTQGYSPQTYGPTQGYPQQGFQQAQTHQWPQQSPQSYPPHSTVPQALAPGYVASQHYTQQQTGFRSYPTPPPSINTNQPVWSNAQGWQQTPNSATYPPTGQYNSHGTSANADQSKLDRNATPTPSSANSTIAPPPPINAHPTSASTEKTTDSKAPLYLGWDDWDFDFDGAIWPKANEPVDPDLSLGVIIWRPAKQVTRALPATFEDAEEQSLKPPAEKLGNGESVSVYFAAENSYEAFLDVRHTDTWYTVKDDPAFVVFPDEEMEQNLVSIDDCLALRDRPDEPVSERIDQDEDMTETSWNVMDNLEQALSGDMEDVKIQTSPRLATKYARDQLQEDILARLGVTGSPKPPSVDIVPVPVRRQDQLPASLPPKPPAPPSASIPPRPEVGPQRAQSYSGIRNSSYANAAPRSYGSLSFTSSQQPPPTQTPGRANSWTSQSRSQYQGSSFSLPVNRAGHLQPESDSTLTRKRSYENTDPEDDSMRQQDDHTKRKRRSLIDAAYSRR